MISSTILTGVALLALFLAIGAGALFQVAFEIGRRMVWQDSAGHQRPWAAFAGVLAGMLMLYLTGVVIK